MDRLTFHFPHPRLALNHSHYYLMFILVNKKLREWATFDFTVMSHMSLPDSFARLPKAQSTGG